MGREALADALSKVVVIDEYTRKRDDWMRGPDNGYDSILVGEDVTLGDVRRWLRKALSERASS